MKCLALSITTLLLIGCNATSDSMKIVVDSTLPNSCELELIEEISNYRNKNKKFPNNINNLKNTLSKDCFNSIDNVKSLEYEVDSIDILYSTNNQEINRKCYRLIYKSDTLSTMRILHNNTIFKTKLLN